VWDQPRTIKLYLHPPLSQRQVTLWPDFKLVNKQVVPPQGQEPDDYGLRLLFGDDLQPLDWLNSSWQIRDDGVPLPAIKARYGALELQLEAFCTMAEQPVTHARLTLQNTSVAPQTMRLGLMPRTGLDRLLIGMHGDYYASYRPQLAHWDMIQATWQLDGQRLSDGAHRIAIGLPDDAELRWQGRKSAAFLANHLAITELTVAGLGEAQVIIQMGDAVASADPQAYTAAYAEALAWWQATLSEITRRPDVPASLEPMVLHLTSQCLQMLAMTADGAIWPRQGGRYDGVWPVETMEWISALAHLGLHRWSARALEFFRGQQAVDGENAGKFEGINSPHWQNETGGVLYALGNHLSFSRDSKALASWRDAILAAVDYLERERNKTRGDESALGYGLMPPGIGHDWQYEGQYWCFSDSLIFMGLSAVARAFDELGDPASQQLADIVSDYRACLERTLARVVAGQDARVDVYIPNVLGISELYPPFGPYCCDGPSNLVRAGIIDANSPLFERLELYWRKRGWMQNGLTAPMTECLMTQGYFADPWAGYTWYVSMSDFQWYHAWLARGERDKAAETLAAQIRYGMSAEYYMLERYAANDPTFCPWQPNASANGRTLEMLFSFYGERTV